jgi:uncharacterized protein with HEPN domain
MLEAAREAEGASMDLTRADLDKDRFKVLGLMKCLEIVGEAASKVSSETRSTYPEIPWSEIVGMRNRLIHVYFDVDLNRMWDTLKEDLPPLIKALERVRRESGAGSGETS